MVDLKLPSQMYCMTREKVDFEYEFAVNVPRLKC